MSFSYPSGPWLDLLLHWGTYGLAVLVPFFFVRAQKALAREFAKKQAALHDQRTKFSWRTTRSTGRKAIARNSWNACKIGLRWFR
jgi:hypothetical protein